MAKSQRRKQRRKQARRESFYEAMPTALPSITAVPVELPELHLPAFDHASTSLRRIAAAMGAVAIGALFDIGNGLWILLRKLVGKKARLMYLVLFIVAGGMGLYMLKQSTDNLVAKYAPMMASPATLITNKTTGITLTDRNGTVLYSTTGQGGTKLTDLKTLPKNFLNATLAAEDPEFYQHDGYSLRSIARAAYTDIKSGSDAEGGSTLTQQLVKNALLTSDKTLTRKYKELVLSNALEQKYSKDQILSMYVSEVPYGQGSYGVEAASETYFHKPASQLDLAQSALLAGLPQATSMLDPTEHPDAAKVRRDYVLNRMADLNLLTPAEAASAQAEAIQVSPRTIQILAPHFVFYALDQLSQEYGQAFLDEGNTVTTTLDLPKQELAQATVTQQVQRLSPNHVTNGGLISLDPGSGDILAMVGSVDYNQPDFGAVNVTLSELQPGSSFKPFAYVTAFEKGWNGSTVVDDAPVSFPDGDSTYAPTDYDGTWKGPVTLRYALSNSLNIPAIKVLQYASISATIATAKSLGVTSLNQPDRYGLSLVLGGAEVSPIDMATAYSAFATGGTKVAPRSILKITDKVGMVRYDAAAKVTGASVLDPRYAYMITSILSDNKARTPDFGPNSPLKLSRPDAAKTGTTNDFRDNWTVGYTPNLVTAVWVGNNDHSAMNGINGITGAAPIWHDYMEGALKNMPVVDFSQPSGITMVPITQAGCRASGAGDTWANEAFLSSALPNGCGGPQPPQPDAPQASTTPTPTSPTLDPVTIDPDPLHTH